MQTYNAPRPHSLAAILAVYLVLPLALNGVIFGMGWQDSHPANPMLPPGWVVGAIWMALFAAMGVARWLLVRGPSPKSVLWIDALGLLCVIYPLYTMGLRSEPIGLAGAIVSAAFAAATAIRIGRSSRTAAALICVVLVWVLYAETALARDLRR